MSEKKKVTLASLQKRCNTLRASVDHVHRDVEKVAEQVEELRKGHNAALYAVDEELQELKKEFARHLHGHG